MQVLRASIQKTGEKNSRYWDNTGHRWNFVFNSHYRAARVYGLFGWQPATHSGCTADVCVLQHGSDCDFGWLDRPVIYEMIGQQPRHNVLNATSRIREEQAFYSPLQADPSSTAAILSGSRIREEQALYTPLQADSQSAAANLTKLRILQERCKTDSGNKNRCSSVPGRKNFPPYMGTAYSLLLAAVPRSAT